MKPDSYCNKPSDYFTKDNLEKLYGLYSEKESCNISQHINRINAVVTPYDNLWEQLKKDNSDLYRQIRAFAEADTSAKGDLDTKMYFITGRQYYSDLSDLTLDQKSKIITVINMFLRKRIGNPVIMPHIYTGSMKNNGDTTFANSPNIGNLRTGINHLINENVFDMKWSNAINNDFLNASVNNLSIERLNQYYSKVKSSLSEPDGIEKTDREFGFERIVRDIIRTDLSGISINSVKIPDFTKYIHYNHKEFETDALGETPDQRWIIEISTGHKSSNEISSKYYKRKQHFDDTFGEKLTIGLFFVSNHGVLKDFKDKIIVLTISELVKILKDNSIKDTISCFGFK